MGSLGVQEMMVIFILALVLFGPKKLPEIGRTVGKAINEFRRASSDLKETFNREMQTLERDTVPKLEEKEPYQYNAGDYDYSSYGPVLPGSPMDGGNGCDVPFTAPENISSESASATEGAELPSAAGPEGTVAQGEAPLAAADGEAEVAQGEKPKAPAVEPSPAYVPVNWDDPNVC